MIIDKEWSPIVEFSGKSTTPYEILEALRFFNPDYFIRKNPQAQIELMLLHLAEHNLIESIDNEPVTQTNKGELSRDSSHWIKYLMIEPLIFIYLLIAALSITLPMMRPSLIPLPRDFYWYDIYSITFLSFFSLSWLTGILHEFAHYVVAGSQGIRSKFEISHRLNFLVMQTKYPNIFSLPKRWRIATFLSGIILDMMIVSVIYIVLILSQDRFLYLPNWTFLLLKQLVLIQWLSISWQFLFYMKTDVYFAIQEITGIQNLYEYVKIKLKSLIWKDKYNLSLSKKTDNIVNTYAVIFIGGTIFALVRWGTYHFPIMLNLLTVSIEHIAMGINSYDFTSLLDGLIVIVIQSITVTILIYTIYKEQKPNIRRFLDWIADL